MAPTESLTIIKATGKLTGADWRAIYEQSIVASWDVLPIRHQPTAIFVGNAPGTFSLTRAFDLLPEMARGHFLSPNVQAHEPEALGSLVNASTVASPRVASVSMQQYLPLHPGFRAEDLSARQARGVVGDARRWVAKAVEDVLSQEKPFVAETDWGQNPALIQSNLQTLRRAGASIKVYMAVPTRQEERVAQWAQEQAFGNYVPLLRAGFTSVLEEPTKGRPGPLFELLGGDKVDLVFVGSDFQVLFDLRDHPRRHDPAFLVGVLKELKDREPTRGELALLQASFDQMVGFLDQRVAQESLAQQIVDLRKEMAQQVERHEKRSTELAEIYSGTVEPGFFDNSAAPLVLPAGQGAEDRRAVIVVTDPSTFNGDAVSVLVAAREGLPAPRSVASVDLDFARKQHPLPPRRLIVNLGQTDADLQHWSNAAIDRAQQENQHVVVTTNAPPHAGLSNALTKLLQTGVDINNMELRIVVPTIAERTQDAWGRHASWLSQESLGASGVGEREKKPESILPVRNPYLEERLDQAIELGLQMGIRKLVLVSRAGEELYNSRNDPNLQENPQWWKEKPHYFQGIVQTQSTRVPTDSEQAHLFHTWANSLLPILIPGQSSSELWDALKPVVLESAQALAKSPNARAALVELSANGSDKSSDRAVAQSKLFVERCMRMDGYDLISSDSTEILRPDQKDRGVQAVIQGPYHTGLRLGNDASRSGVVVSNAVIESERRVLSPLAPAAKSSPKPSSPKPISATAVAPEEITASLAKARNIASGMGLSSVPYDAVRGLQQLHGCVLKTQTDHHLVFTTANSPAHGGANAAIIVSQAVFNSNKQPIPSLGSAYQHPGVRPLSGLEGGRAAGRSARPAAETAREQREDLSPPQSIVRIPSRRNGNDR